MRKTVSEAKKDYLANRNIDISKRSYAKRWNWSPIEASQFINGMECILEDEAYIHPKTEQNSVYTDTTNKSVYTPSVKENNVVNTPVYTHILEEVENEVVQELARVYTQKNSPSKHIHGVYTFNNGLNKDTQPVYTLCKAFLYSTTQKPIVFNVLGVYIRPVTQGFYISLEISSLSLTYWNSNLKEKEKLKQKEKERIGRNPSFAVRDNLSRTQEVAENKALQSKQPNGLYDGDVENLTPKQQKEVARLEKEQEKALLLEKREVLLDEALLMWNELVSTPLGRAKVFNVNSSITRGMLFHTLEKASVELELKGERRIFQGLDLWQLICWTLGKSEFYKGKPNAYTLSSVANFDLVGEKIAQSSVDVAMNIANPSKAIDKVDLGENMEKAMQQVLAERKLKQH